MIDYRLYLEERAAYRAAWAARGRLELVRLRKAHQLMDAVYDDAVERGLSDAEIDAALAAVQEPDTRWIREGLPWPAEREGAVALL